MARIFKNETPQWRQLTELNLRELQEFPPDERIQFHLGPEEPAESLDEAEEALPDFEEIRAQVIAEARDEAERMVQAAYTEGYQRGETAGYEAFEARIAGSAEALNLLTEQLLQRREEFLESLEPQVIALSKLIAERVLAREIRGDDQIIRDTVRRALMKIADRQKVTVQIHPEDLAIIQEFQPDLQTEFPGIESFIIEANPAITRGGCIVESELMRVDARLETLLTHVLEALTE